MIKPKFLKIVLLACCLIFPAVSQAAPNMDKAQLAKALAGSVEQLVEAPSIVVKTPAGPILVESTLWPQLQRQAENLLIKSKSVRASLVLMDAQTGQIMVMAGSKGNKVNSAVALDADPPAASLFKIVTAAAAVEETSLHPNSPLTFVGRPHTLYESQIKAANHPQGTQVSLQQSFAASNNPVFAKLGIHLIGRDLLAWYGKALGFESKLPFELPLGVSALCPAPNNFAVGEMASGFNRETTISPVHAAMLGSVFINGGRLMEPYVVSQVSSNQGDILYRGGPRSLGRIVSTKTANQMQSMFLATVKEGTARSYFRQISSDPYLKNVIIGGKTGTISRSWRNENYEWFVGFAKDTRTGRTYAIAALVVHGKLRGQSAKELARLLLHEAYSEKAPTQMVYKPSQPNL